MRIPSTATVGVLVAVTVAAGCRAGPAPQVPPGPSSPPAQAASEGTAIPPRRYVAADAEFMRRMIGHHDQALVMTALVPARGASEAVRLMAQRIEVSQRDEIGRMQRWLVERGEAIPPGGAEHHHGSASHTPAMPGMLSSAELQRLSESTGPAFDRLFLESMIRHHEGALVMVAELFATPGAGQELDIFRFASDVDADQRAEIRRMRMLVDRLSR